MSGGKQREKGVGEELKMIRARAKGMPAARAREKVPLLFGAPRGRP